MQFFFSCIIFTRLTQCFSLFEFTGDVVGINNPGNIAIGDTLYTGNSRIAYPGIPSFSPEKFAYIRNPNPSTYKSFQKGIDQLLAEGAVQALRQRVVQACLKNEYNVESDLELISFSMARWADGGWDAVDKADADGKLFGIMVAHD